MNRKSSLKIIFCFRDFLFGGVWFFLYITSNFLNLTSKKYFYFKITNNIEEKHYKKWSCIWDSNSEFISGRLGYLITGLTSRPKHDKTGRRSRQCTPHRIASPPQRHSLDNRLDTRQWAMSLVTSAFFSWIELLPPPKSAYFWSFLMESAYLETAPSTLALTSLIYDPCNLNNRT